MKHTECRQQLRSILAGDVCLSPATVYDALSARIAERVGFRIGVLSGSVCGATILAAPDIALQTLDEFADQVRRIMRATRLSLIVDADHGYGNALNVMRTVEELEHAGVAGLMIEDTVMPHRFGAGGLEVVSIAEMTGKLRAALRAREDPSLVIVGRIAALKTEDTRRAAERARAYAATGVDALFVTGLRHLDEFDALRAAVDLPIIVGLAPALQRDDLAPRGVRLFFQGHQPVAAAAKALRAAYTHLYQGGAPSAMTDMIASAEEMDAWMNAEQYAAWRREFLT